jgi:AcrR family transcriptional regulator
MCQYSGDSYGRRKAQVPDEAACGARGAYPAPDHRERGRAARQRRSGANLDQGVRRSTVYRHFPDEAALFAACSSHWRAANPAPDPARWEAIDEPDLRLRTALEELYAHYRRTERMLDNLVRDEKTVPAVQGTFAAFRSYLAAVAVVLTHGRRLRGAAGERVRAAIGHTLAFGTWQSLAREQGLGDAQAADLMCRLVAAAAAR